MAAARTGEYDAQAMRFLFQQGRAPRSLKWAARGEPASVDPVGDKTAGPMSDRVERIPGAWQGRKFARQR